MSVSLTLGQGLTIGNGITFGAGTGGGGGTSFTVGPADIQVHGNGQHYGGYSNISATDFTSDGTNLENGVAYNITYSALYNQIVQIYTNAGFNLNDNYVWNVTWTIGGTGKVRLAIDAAGSNSLVIAPIDQTDTGWQTGSTSGPTQTGTFGFPATFTLYSPTTQLYNNNQWC